MTHEQLLNHHLRKVKQWKEEKEWYIEELAKRRDSKLMKQVKFLLEENSQLHKEINFNRALIATYVDMNMFLIKSGDNCAEENTTQV